MIPVTFKHGLGVFAKLQRVATECMLISLLFLGGYLGLGFLATVIGFFC